MPRSNGKPTIAERLAAKQAEIDAKRAGMAVDYEQAKADAGLADLLPVRGGGQGLRGWVKEHRAERVAEFAGLHLFADRIVRAPGLGDPPGAPDSRPVADVVAEVGTAGGVSARATLTRAAVPGLHGWQKKRDGREAWLTVDGPGFQWVVPIPPNQSAAARQFAAAVTTAGRG